MSEEEYRNEERHTRMTRGYRRTGSGGPPTSKPGFAEDAGEEGTGG